MIHDVRIQTYSTCIWNTSSRTSALFVKCMVDPSNIHVNSGDSVEDRIAAMIEYRGTLFENHMSEFIATFWILDTVRKDKGRLYGQVASTFL